MLNLKRVLKAEERLKSVAYRTPFAYAPLLSSLSGYKVYLKKENLQRTGSFKLRGAFNKIATIIEEREINGVVAASAGNHAQGVAFSAKHFGIEGTIVMPESTPLTKVMGVKELGSKVILKGSNYDDAYSFAVEYAKEHNKEFIHPFADDEVIAGQGTIALEMLEDIPDLDAIVVPVGGGGLISGISLTAKSKNPDINIIGVASAGAPAMKLSFDNRDIINTTGVRTIADGIAVRETSEITLKYILEYVDKIELVREGEIANAILFLLEKQKLLVEGAGAVGVAGVMHNQIELPKGSKIGIILSGGNIDVTMLSLIIEKGLMKSFRNDTDCNFNR